MPRYCPTCNRSSDDVKFYGSFCEKCEAQKLLAKLNDKVEVKRCKSCGRIWVGPEFVEQNGRTMEQLIASRFHGYITHIITLENGKALVDITEALPDGNLSVEKNVMISYKKVTCDKCYKRIGGYYEAVVQLRGDPHRVKRYIDRLERYAEEHDEYVAEVKEVDNGVDVYMSSKRMVGAFMTENDLSPRKSYTLAGRRNGKEIYKNTYALHLDKG